MEHIFHLCVCVCVITLSKHYWLSSLTRPLHLTFPALLPAVTDSTNRLNSHWSPLNQQYINQSFQLVKRVPDQCDHSLNPACKTTDKADSTVTREVQLTKILLTREQFPITCYVAPVLSFGPVSHLFNLSISETVIIQKMWPNQCLCAVFLSSFVQCYNLSRDRS